MGKIRYIYPILKIIGTYILAQLFYRKLFNQEIWLIGEKKTEARDNGYHFFKYVREHHPEINAYYVITKKSSDLSKVEKYGNIIHCYTLKHYLYFLTASKHINSQVNYSAFPFWPSLANKFPFLINKKQKKIFLRHGVVKDKLNNHLDYQNSKISLLTCSAKRERDFIINTHQFPEENVKLMGLCRFDNLHNIKHKLKKQILIMPTFRNWLVSSDRTKEATEAEKRKFIKSDFYKHYISLLKSNRLNRLLNEFDFDLVFYPHYSMQSYINLFKEGVNSNRIVIADRFKFDVQDLLVSSSILITDFSSVFFDFAYMEKPEIFFQFDIKEYRNHHYKEGYFSYKNDGFGPVVETVDDVFIELERILLNGVTPEEKYIERVDDFFFVRDTQNCKRTFEAVTNLE